MPYSALPECLRGIDSSYLVKNKAVMTKSNYCQGSRHEVSAIYMLMTVLFCCCLIISNLVEIKTIDIGPLTITAGVITFPIAYIINDCVVEIYGFSKARLMIWIGFAANLIVTLLLQLAIVLPGSAEWEHQEALATIFSAVPRILIASFIAFLIGSIINAAVMSRMKARNGRRHFSARAIISTVLGEGADSLIFFPIAFAGNLPATTIVSLILTQTLIKTVYEIIILPVTITTVGKIRRLEGGDTTDNPQTTTYGLFPHFKQR